MSAIQDKIIEIVNRQPEDSTYEEIIKEIIFDGMIEQGLDDVRNGRTISNEEMKKRIASWPK